MTTGDGAAPQHTHPADGGRWLRLGPAAKLLGVSLNTLRRWSDSGHVPCYRSSGGHRRYDRVELEALLTAQAGATGAAGAGKARPRRPRKPPDQATVDRLVRHSHNLEVLVSAGMQDAARHSTDQIVRAVARRISRLTHTPVVDLYAVEHDTMRALVSFDHGRFDKDWEGVVVPLHDFPCSAAAVDEQRIFVAANLDDPILAKTQRGRISLETWGYESQLAMPLLSRGRVIGLVELSDYEPRDWAEDRDLIEGLGRIAGRALDNATVFELIERRNHVLHELVELGALVNTAHDVVELLRAVAKRLVIALDLACCDVFTLEGDDQLWSRVSYGREGFDEASCGHVLRVDEFASARQAFETMDLVVIPDLNAPTVPQGERNIAARWGYVSLVTVPLIVDGRIHGMLDLYHDRPTDFADYLDFLKTVGQIIAGALQKTLLVEQLGEGNRQLNLLVESGLDFGSSLELDEVLSSVSERMRSLTDADSCEVCRLQDGQLTTLVSVGRKGRHDGMTGLTFPLSELPQTTTVVTSRAPLVVSGENVDGEIGGRKGAWARWAARSSVLLPLIVHNEVIGLVGLHDQRARDFAHLELLQGLAQIAAQAVDNASLMTTAHERGRVLRELVDLGAMIWESGDLGGLSAVVARRLTATTGAFCCEIYRAEESALVCVASYDTDNGASEHRVGEPLSPEEDFPSTMQAMAAGQPLVIASLDDPRLTAAEHELFEHWGFASELTIPLIVDERVIGMIDIFDRRPRDYGSYLDFLRSAGQMVAGAFANATLLEQLNASNRELETLVDSGLEFGSSLDLERVLSTVAERMRDVADVAVCDIYALEGEKIRGLMSVDAGGVDPAFTDAVWPLEDYGTAQLVVESKGPVGVGDASTDPRVSESERAAWLAFGYVSALRLPLLTRGEVAGFVTLFDMQPREFERVHLLQGLAQIAAQAVDNASLYRRLDRNSQRLRVINEASLELSSTLSLRSVLLSTAKRLCTISEVPCCDIYILDEGHLECVASVRGGEPDPDWEGTTIPLGEWASDKLAVMTRRTIALTSREDPKRSREEMQQLVGTPWESQLTVPLIANDKVIGVVEMLDTQRGRIFSPENTATVEAVCRSSALAIDNANLFEQMQLRRRETELLNAVARRTAASLNITEIAAATVEELRQLIAFDRATVSMTAHDGTMPAIYSTEEWEPQSRAPSDHTQLERQSLDDVRRKRVVIWDFDQAQPGQDAHAGHVGLRSGASVALTRGDELVGMLDLGAKTPNAFTTADRRLLERVGTHLSLAINNARLYDEIKRMHLGNLKALSSALNAKDYYTLGHAARVSAYSVLLAQELGWDDEFVHQLEEAAYLHDIGKIGVSDRVLLKPAGLNAKEWEMMRQHPMFSADIIRPLFSEEFVLGVRHHHERWDGRGYPDGLSGTDIPKVARAMCIVDSYDAMSFRRPYRSARFYAEALNELRACRGTHFDPDMVDAFCRVLDRMKRERNEARAVAAEAARQIDAAKHALLRDPGDEGRPEYEEIASMLRRVRDAHPPTRFISTHAQTEGKRYILICDGETRPEMHSPLGSSVHADEELPEVFAGRIPDVNVLYVDEWGVWVTGIAPVFDENGRVEAVVSADLPPAGLEMEGLRSDVTETFANHLHTTAERLTREALDAITDGLTGLYNHRYLHERLSEELERAREQSAAVSVLFLDLDQFKAFNDRHGHSAGDAALRGVSRIIEDCIRHVDLAARYGGEEFAVILLDTHAEGAIEVADRIREQVAESEFIPDRAVHVTVSIGVATFPDDADRKEGLLDRADWAMYLAKRRGRNRVMSFAEGQKTAIPGQIGYAPGQTHLTLMAQLVDAKDSPDEHRSERVTGVAGRVAQDMGLSASQIDEVLEVAHFCDLGMVGVPDEFISRAGPLNAEELAVMRSHPATAERLLHGFGVGERIVAAVAHHHEHFDGSGYPAGLHGDEIPVASRIVLAASAWLAMTTPRPYRARLSSDEALAELRRCTGAQFDPEVVAAVARIAPALQRTVVGSPF